MPESRPIYEPVPSIQEPELEDGCLHFEQEALDRKISRRERHFKLLTILLVFSIFLNAASGAYWMLHQGGARVVYQSAQTSSRIPIIYDSYHEGFDDDDVAKSDSYWSSLFPGGNGVVSLSDEMAEGLPSSIRAPEEDNRSLYIMAGYHSLHCLTHIRHIVRSYYFAQDSQEAYRIGNGTWGHTKHCIGDLRQSLMCNLDETLLAQPDQSHDPGDGQKLQCKSLTPINEWLVSHRHFAEKGDITDALDTT